MIMSAGIRKSSGRKKKPIGYPKRPLSAYNIFFQKERQIMLLEKLHKSPLPPDMMANALASGRDRPHCKRHGKLDFQGLVRTVAAKWRTITSVEKKVYEDHAKTDKQRYAVELEAWKKSHDQLGNPIASHIPNFENTSSNGEEIVVFSTKVEAGFTERFHSSSQNLTQSNRTQIYEESHEATNVTEKYFERINRETWRDFSATADSIKHTSNTLPLPSTTNLKTQKPNYSYALGQVGDSSWLANHLDNDCIDFFVNTFGSGISDQQPQGARSRAA
mmetsp:Transcript_26687/g.37614  ORF Transcript_26687/g.37614 Transcript_26687/m.37614 type:complete len:275 (+) Transcript_26687:260-1084(+)